MARRKTEFTVPQPLRVRLEAPEKPHLLSWRESFRQRPMLLVGILVMSLLLAVGALLSLAMLMYRDTTVVTLSSDQCAVTAYLNYPHYATVRGDIHLSVTLQNTLDCDFSGKVVLTPQETTIGVLPAAEITQTPVWDVTVPPHSITTLNASLQPVHKSTLRWHLVLVNASGASDPELGETTVWPFAAYILTRLTALVISLSFLGALSTVLGLWPALQRALDRLRMP